MKKILLFLLFLLPWYFSSLLIQGDYSFYQEINLPSFAPGAMVFGIAWTIIYIGIAITLYQIHKTFRLQNLKEYSKMFLFNYFFNQLYPILFFKFENLFFSFVCCVIINISTLILYYETKDLQKRSSYFLLPYLFWTTFATILSIAIYLMNF